MFTALQEEEFWSLTGNDDEISNVVFTERPAHDIYFLFADCAFSNNKTISHFYFGRLSGDLFEKDLEKSLTELSASDLFIFFDSSKSICMDYTYLLRSASVVTCLKVHSGFYEAGVLYH